MGFLQRIAITYAFLLIQIGLLVYYLDDGLRSEPLMVFTVAWLFDSLVIFTLLVRCMRRYNVCGLHEGIDELRENETGLKSTIYDCSAFIAKLVFEILLYIQLKSKEHSILTILIPFWTFLVLAIGRLLQHVVKQHSKVS
ncbi:unnamed protein product [Bursaphelenchus xylophilus]|uniref:(pine wood nematode) hypothetical protein n=1 Tax=Bursaphelenchus xylophilus TaxID=6326 RepID=A0A1I7SHY0_BURXY|nr:unnamed protein product [Bursaphelenchus xylophilus]CAG9128318.1 unnamed protein product [Bursaphelenchus xylophilus]